VEVRFSEHVRHYPVVNSGSNTITGSFLGVKRPGFDDHPPDLVPRLEIEYTYSSTQPLGLHDRKCGEL
jgi:hypothetical protein